ncbi:MAG: ATP-binding cassette domain-containing protein [Pusillimonas sp.]
MFITSEFDELHYTGGVSRRPHEAPDTPDANDEPAVRITLNGLNKQFGDRQVLKSLDLHVAPGQFVTIVGRSGCGKSTLLRLLAGLDRPSSIDVAPPPGTSHQGDAIQFNGTPQHGADHRARIMYQESRLLPWKSVLDNVALGLPKTARGDAVKVLRKVGLGDRGGEWPSALSGGQRQRVALARALVHQPRLLLLDEPLGALDALTRIGMQQLIEDVWQREGFTAVLVTHDVSEAVALGDRVLVIEEGRIVLDEQIDLARPRARGSAAFAALEERVLNVVLARPNETSPPPAAPAFSLQHLRLAV